MRNFQKLADVNIAELSHSIQRQPELWNQNDLRTQYPNSPHIEADDIWLRFNDRKIFEEDPTKIMNDYEAVNYPAWDILPQCHEIVFGLMRSVRGTRLGRVMITRLAPGKKIKPHSDGGYYADYYDRYHCVLQNFPGSYFRAGDEKVTMKAGEVWWFNNSIEHEVINNSAEDRVTMIIDIRTM